MTDKQIIDGIDVSECIFYQANFEEDFDVKIKHFCSNWHNSCESINNYNCYYKQLKHKEQECEMFKTALKQKIEEHNKLTVNYDAYVHMTNIKLKAKEQECEELKKIINEAKNSKLDLKSFLVGEAVQNEYQQKIDQLKAENKDLKRELMQYEKDVKDLNYCAIKYKQTVTEIKEIAEKFYYQELGNRDCMDCDDYCFDKIRQKISEVENEN